MKSTHLMRLHRIPNPCRMYLVEARQWLEIIVLAEVQHQGEQTEDLSVEAELQEEPVIVLSHAVIDPGGRRGVKTQRLRCNQLSHSHFSDLIRKGRAKKQTFGMFWLYKGVCVSVCARVPTKDSGGPSCAHSGRSGCSGGSVLAA